MKIMRFCLINGKNINLISNNNNYNVISIIENDNNNDLTENEKKAKEIEFVENRLKKFQNTLKIEEEKTNIFQTQSERDFKKNLKKVEKRIPNLKFKLLETLDVVEQNGQFAVFQEFFSDNSDDFLLLIYKDYSLVFQKDQQNNIYVLIGIYIREID